MSRLLDYINTVKNELYIDLFNSYTQNQLLPFKDEMKKYVCNGDCITGSRHTSYSYFSLNDNNQTVGFYSRAAKKDKAVALSSYSQCYAFFNEPVDFNTAFYSEDQIDCIANQNAFNCAGEPTENIENFEISYTSSAIKVILCKAFLRWIMGERQIVIAVPSDVEDYDKYVINAVRKIYSYFPYAMRREVGFSSYLSYSKFKTMQCYYIIFVPQAEAHGDCILLDKIDDNFKENIFENALLSKGLKDFIDYIVDLKDKKGNIDELFDSISEDYEKAKNFSPSDYSKCGELLETLNVLNNSDYSAISGYLEKSSNYSYVNKEIVRYIREKIGVDNLLKYVESESISDTLLNVSKIIPLIKCDENIYSEIRKKLEGLIETEYEKADGYDEKKRVIDSLQNKKGVLAVFAFDTYLNELKTVNENEYKESLFKRANSVIDDETNIDDITLIVKKYNNIIGEAKSKSRDFDLSAVITHCERLINNKILEDFEGIKKKENSTEKLDDLRNLRLYIQNYNIECNINSDAVIKDIDKELKDTSNLLNQKKKEEKKRPENIPDGKHQRYDNQKHNGPSSKKKGLSVLDIVLIAVCALLLAALIFGLFKYVINKPEVNVEELLSQQESDIKQEIRGIEKDIEDLTGIVNGLKNDIGNYNQISDDGSKIVNARNVLNSYSENEENLDLESVINSFNTLKHELYEALSETTDEYRNQKDAIDGMIQDINNEIDVIKEKYKAVLNKDYSLSNEDSQTDNVKERIVILPPPNLEQAGEELSEQAETGQESIEETSESQESDLEQTSEIIPEQTDNQ